jgi:HEAT repeat protein
MEAVPTNLQTIVDGLADPEKPLSHASLADLSNLSTPEAGYLAQVWAKIELSRRRKVIARLVELAEENFELNYDIIYKNLLRDEDPEIRVKAIEGLWENEEPSMILTFIRMLNEDKSEIVQAAAAKALSKFAMLAELKKLGPASSSRVAQALLSILNDPTKPPEVWRRALEAAAPLSLPEVKKAIGEAYKSADPKIKNSALYSMGKNCDSAWLPILIKEMSNLNADVRYEAAGACGEVCDEEAVPYLIKMTNDKDYEVQQAAIVALGKIGGIKAKAHLMKLVNHPDENIADAAETALKQVDTEDEELF